MLGVVRIIMTSLLLLLTSNVCEAQDDRLTIAILEFDAINQEAKASNKGRIVSEKITTEAVKSGQFKVVERQLIKQVLDENQFGDAGISGPIAQQIGQLLGADAVMTGSVSQYKGELSIDARLVNVAEGRILMAEEAYAKDDLFGISDAAKQVYRRMVGIVTPQQARDSSPSDSKVHEVNTPHSGQQGKWFVIMASFPTSSREAAKRRLASIQRDVPAAYLINSSEYGNLANNLFVVVEGPYDKPYAKQRLDEVKKIVADAYIKSGW